MCYTDPQGQSQPVNDRVYDKVDGKTKNDYFLDMLTEVLSWGLKPSFVTGDSWYSCVKNLKAVKNYQLGFLFAAICGYVELQRLRAIDVISNCYKLRRDLFNEVIASFIEVFAQNKTHLNPKFQAVVNA